MSKYVFILNLIFLLFCSGCASRSNQETGSITVTPSIGNWSHPGVGGWKVVDQPVINLDKVSIFVNADIISGHDTTFLYATIGEGNDILNQSSLLFQLRDNNNHIYELLSGKNLATKGNVSVGIMRFKPRIAGASELYLQAINNLDKTNINEAKIVEFTIPPEDPSVIQIRNYQSNAHVSFEKDGYRIKFFGWWPPQTKSVPTLNPTDLPQDVIISERATVEIDDLSTNKVYYVYIQFLSNGEVTSIIIE